MILDTNLFTPGAALKPNTFIVSGSGGSRELPLVIHQCMVLCLTSYYSAPTAAARPRAVVLKVLEEMPGHISRKDQTSALASRGFWSSYNVASDPEIFAISGQQALVDEYGGPTGPGAFFTWANTSRARIFARDAPSVVDDASYRKVIRYNNAPNDPESKLGCGVNPPYSCKFL